MINKIFIFLFSFSFIYSIHYETKFIGLKDKKIQKKIENAFSLFPKSSPPRTVNAIAYKVDKKIDDVKKIFHSYGYYDANISYDIEEENQKIILFVFFDPGTRYIFSSCKIDIIPYNEKSKKFDFNIKDVNLELNRPTNSLELSNLKYKILKHLHSIGYPLSLIKEFNILVNRIKKTISLNVSIELGPLAHFGYSKISGIKSIKPSFIAKRIMWREKDLYSVKKVLETQERLTKTNLFSSVIINHSKKLNDENLLPMEIEVIESKHQHMFLGINYATVDGFGYIIGWNHQNIRKLGEKLAFLADISKRAYTGYVTYKKPDFLFFDQELVLRGFGTREKIRAYTAHVYGGLVRLDHTVSKQFKYSYGLEAEYIEVTDSANNNKFNLLSIPFYFKYNNTGSLLDPKKGIGITYLVAPFAKMQKKRKTFLKQKLVTELYFPTKKNHKLVYAFRLQLGSILGSSLYNIPMTKLFLGGSNEDLRGYRYKTVSPRDSNNKIIGGRSVIYFTFEPRLRLTKSFGIVPFVDVGNVRKKAYPTIHGKWRKSLGIGVRYFTFFGPIRLDVGFPLDKYKKTDPNYRLYVSIGQTF